MCIDSKRVAHIAVKLVKAGYADEALLILEAKKKKKGPDYYKKRAKKRMDDAFDRAGGGAKGVAAVLKATKLRIKKTTLPIKLWGIVDALDDLIMKSRDLQTEWGVKDADKKFVKLRDQAKAKAKKIEKSAISRG